MNLLMQVLAAQGEMSAAPVPSETVSSAQSIPPEFFGRLPIEDIWQFIANVSWIQAVVFVTFGLIYLSYGWRMFKMLAVINSSMLGMFAGIYLGTKLGSALWGGIFGAFLSAIFSWRLLKYSVSVLGALAGTVLGAALWRIAALPEPLTWCGALAGLIAGGFLAFSSFKISVMLFTSLQGSVFLMIGILALLSDYPDLGARLTNVVYSKVFLLPMLLIVPTVIGIFFQQQLLKRENDWAMPK